MRFHAFVAAILAMIGFANPAHAYTIVVPDDSPTIQIAVDALTLGGGHPDTVLVRAGLGFEEDVVLTDRITLIAADTTARPAISSIRIVPHLLDLSEYRFDLAHLAIRRALTIDNDDYFMAISLVDCTLGAGIDDVSPITETATLRIERCDIQGGVRAKLRATCTAVSSRISGSLRIGGDAALNVADCIFEGDGTGTAIGGLNKLLSATIERNRIRSYQRGISVTTDMHALIQNNRVEDCSSIGIDAADYEVVIDNNLVSRCFYGIATNSQTASITRNVVNDATEYGIHAWCEDSRALIEGNVVSGSGSDGIILYGNVSDYGVVRGNTIFGSAGNGITVAPETYEGARLEVNDNLSIGNAGHGLAWVTRLPGTTNCNDWFGNGSGAVSGRDSGPTDVSMDPMFCDPASGDFRLHPGSPVLGVTDCGPIGALAEPCADTTTTPTLVTQFTAERSDAGIRIRWQIAEGSVTTSFWIERAEQESGPWDRIVTERSRNGGGYVELDRGAGETQAYWYRLMRGEAAEMIAGPLSVPSSRNQDFALERTTPNPSSGPIAIQFSLPHAAEISIDVFDLAGRHVKALVRGAHPAGRHTVEWSGGTESGTRAGAGAYWVILRHPAGRSIERVLRLQ